MAGLRLAYPIPQRKDPPDVIRGHCTDHRPRPSRHPSAQLRDSSPQRSFLPPHLCQLLPPSVPADGQVLGHRLRRFCHAAGPVYTRQTGACTQCVGRANPTDQRVFDFSSRHRLGHHLSLAELSPWQDTPDWTMVRVRVHGRTVGVLGKKRREEPVPLQHALEYG